MKIPDNASPKRAVTAGEPGEVDLQTLLDSLAPKLMTGNFVFCSIEGATYGDYAELGPIASFQEPEGLTLVMLKESADHCGLNYSSIYRCITLGVHSSLDAIGLTAAVSTRLGAKQISVNMIAACFHDHLFIPADRADEALVLLSGMNSEEDLSVKREIPS